MVEALQGTRGVLRCLQVERVGAYRGDSDSEEENRSVATESEEEADEEKESSSSSSRYKLSLEEVDDLLKTIHTTLNITEDKALLSLHDKMFQGMGEVKHRMFPVHKFLSETIKREWKDPERAPFFSRSLKRRFPFEEDSTQVWNKKPRLDAAFSHVSRNTDLAFEDMGILKDPMDKRADSLLKKAWDSTLANLKPAMASTVVARNLEHWLEQLKAHIEAGTPRKDLLETLPVLMRAVGYIADASAESVRMSARSSALINSTRRALWVKTWTGDTASKTKLCGLPFEGDLVFGPGLEAILERMADKKKAFPIKKKVVPQGNKNFRPFRKTSDSKETGYKRPWRSQRGRGKSGVLFRPPTPNTKSQ
ncbi:hypothetical protein AB205_0081150 [Aquarana catesbeiana]|uniref:Lamina-associated polypeptide 2 alpha C-terminal domain-containing protein n=1 Tax=Aquarana catesbeiana TaxID=8400 RepID=A0A2G9NB94_AQUCT|nr:hypothetical protein AB205_0081150 [Aquarana catesbeiana]